MSIRDVAPAFHAHLDACERCRTKPFDLCAVGARLLEAEGSKVADACSNVPKVRRG